MRASSPFEPPGPSCDMTSMSHAHALVETAEIDRGTRPMTLKGFGSADSICAVRVRSGRRPPHALRFPRCGDFTASRPGRARTHAALRATPKTSPAPRCALGAPSLSCVRGAQFHYRAGRMPAGHTLGAPTARPRLSSNSDCSRHSRAPEYAQLPRQKDLRL